MAEVVLRLTDVVKTYPGVVALDGVSLEVRAGEVHALVGENGAGKSTLMGIAAGAAVPDRGTVEIMGSRLAHASPTQAQTLGLAVVYQHPTVLEDLTVAENLVFSMPPGRRPRLGSAASAWAGRYLAEVGAAVDPSVRLAELGVAERQLVEIARALALDAAVLILDEPTETLTAVERERLFTRIHALRARGTGIVYISHRFPEVRRLADRITVLRDGRTRGTFAAESVTEHEVLSLIVGRDVAHAFPDKRPPDPPEPAGSPGPPVLSIGGLSSSHFQDVALDVAPGEIIGLAGVEGNGQREVLRALAGLHPSTGEAAVNGERVRLGGPAAVQRADIVHLPGDRHREGAFLPRSIRENLSVLVLAGLSRLGIVSRAKDSAHGNRLVTQLRIRTPSVESPVETLSGGNQQKVVFARSLAARPRVLLADEPTRGVDVGARAEIYRLLREFAAEGNAVVVVSADAAELQGLCDRVLVFSRGEVVASLSGEALTESAITSAAITAGGTQEPQPADPSQPADPPRSPPRHRLIRSDYAPSGVLAMLIVALGAYTTVVNPLFLSSRSLHNLLFLASILAVVALGQLVVLLVGSLDLSVGPLIGLTVVVLSFFATDGRGMGGLAVGVAVALAVGVAVGLANGLLIRLAHLPPVIATLVTFIFLQGLALLLRPEPGGYIDASVMQALTNRIATIPWTFAAVVVLAVVAERALRRSGWGLELRAVGSSEPRARRLGARPAATVILAHIVCALAAVLAGVVLTALIGVGQASLGTQYTLSSIAAVVLGGASIFGGRGSFIGALLGAVLVQEIISATSFLGLGEEWQQWLPGLLILAGAGLYSRVRVSSAGGTGSRAPLPRAVAHRPG